MTWSKSLSQSISTPEWLPFTRRLGIPESGGHGISVLRVPVDDIECGSDEKHDIPHYSPRLPEFQPPVPGHAGTRIGEGEGAIMHECPTRQSVVRIEISLDSLLPAFK